MRSLARILQVALAEWAGALRSRRALVMLLLYLVAAVACMYITISVFGRMEAELAKTLKLPNAGSTGMLSNLLWKSEQFQGLIRSLVNDKLVYLDIRGRHPIELVYAFFSFALAPLLVVMVAGNRVSDDLRNGAVRYAIVRCTRLEWSLGKSLGQAMMLGCGLVVSAIGAWGVATCRLSDAASTLPAMLDWSARCWMYSLAWLGVALGISHLTRRGSLATALGIFAVFALCALPGVLQIVADKVQLPWLPVLEVFSPSAAKSLLWRRSFAPLARAALWLGALGMMFLMAGNWHFRRRDA